MARRVVAVVVALLFVAAAVRLVTADRQPAAVRAARHAPADLRKAHWFRLSLQLQLVEADGTARATTATASVDAANDRAAVTVPAVLGRPDLELVAQGPIMYLSIPADHRAALSNARWIRVDAGNAEAAAGARIGPLPGPIAVLDALRTATTPTTKGRVRLDLQRLPHTPAGREVYNALIPLGRRFDADLTFDNKGRLQTVAFATNVTEQRRVDVRLTVDGVGQEFVIGVPPDSATVPAPSLREALTMVGASPLGP